MTAKLESSVQLDRATMESDVAPVAILEEQSWLEKKIKPKKVNARYPIKGKPLLFMTCAFGSLGDALFGYNSGMARGR